MYVENAREAFDKLRQEVTSGNISCDDIIKRLTVAIEVEYQKKTPNIDFINSCEDFLWELGTQGQQVYISSNQRYIQAIQQASILKRDTPSLWGISKRLGAIAAVFLLVFGLSQGALRLRWFTHDSDQDGEIYIIQGHEITVDLIQSALADHTENTYIRTDDWDELYRYLGFAPSVIAPDYLHASSVTYFVHMEDGLIIVDALYEDSMHNTIAVLKNEYYLDSEEAYFMLQQNTNGNHVILNHCSVYVSENVDRTSFTWLNDFTLTTLSGSLSIEQGLEIVDQLTRRPSDE